MYLILSKTDYCRSHKCWYNLSWG